MSKNIRVHTGDVFRAFNELRGDIEDAAEDIALGAAFIIEGEAKILAPVDEGTLRSGINARRVSRFHAEVANSVEHAIHQEYGTRHQPGTPHMRPAIDNKQDEIVAYAIRELNRRINK